MFDRAPGVATVASDSSDSESDGMAEDLDIIDPNLMHNDFHVEQLQDTDHYDDFLEELMTQNRSHAPELMAPNPSHNVTESRAPRNRERSRHSDESTCTKGYRCWMFYTLVVVFEAFGLSAFFYDWIRILIYVLPGIYYTLNVKFSSESNVVSLFQFTLFVAISYILIEKGRYTDCLRYFKYFEKIPAVCEEGSTTVTTWFFPKIYNTAVDTVKATTATMMSMVFDLVKIFDVMAADVNCFHHHINIRIFQQL